MVDRYIFIWLDFWVRVSMRSKKKLCIYIFCFASSFTSYLLLYISITHLVLIMLDLWVCEIYVWDLIIYSLLNLNMYRKMEVVYLPTYLPTDQTF